MSTPGGLDLGYVDGRGLARQWTAPPNDLLHNYLGMTCHYPANTLFLQRNDALTRTGAGSVIPNGPSVSLHDPIFCCFDVEDDCKKPQFVAEVGMAYLDMRNPKLHDAQNLYSNYLIPPGDRGSDWFKFIKTTHWRPLESTHASYTKAEEGNHEKWCKSKMAHAFMFGTTTHAKADIVKQRIRASLLQLQTYNLTGQEKADGTTRNVIILAFSPTKEAKLLTEVFPEILKVGQHAQAAMHLWDIQKTEAARYLATAFNKQTCTFEDFATALGLNFQPKYLHNGGNDAALELQAFIASAFLTPAQLTTIRAPSPLIRLTNAIYGEKQAIRSNVVEESVAQQGGR